jgi:hypothetical protein
LNEIDVHLAFSRGTYYAYSISPAEEADVSRFQRLYAVMFTLTVTGALLMSTVVFAVNDPK